MKSNPDTSNDKYIGIGCSFVMLLVVALIIGMPLKDLALWAGIFAIGAALIFLYLRRRQNRP